MRKIIIILTAFLIVVSLLSCSAEQVEQVSAYEQLTTTEKAVVDTMLENDHVFSWCNHIDFAKYQGEYCFSAELQVEVDHEENGLPYVGSYNAKEIYYIVRGGRVENASSTIQPQIFHPYYQMTHGTSYGSGTWDDDWSDTEKREALSRYIKAR